MLERDLEKILVDEVKNAGGKAYKFICPGNSGVPDRIVILPGRPPVFAELKAEGGELSAVQKVQINRLVELGQAVYIVRGLDGLAEFFRDVGMRDAYMRHMARKTAGRGKYGV